MRLPAVAFAMVLCAASWYPVSAQDKLTLPEKRAFFLFDRLELFERGQLAGAKLVRFTSAWKEPDGSKMTRSQTALLIDDQKNTFEIISLDLSRHTFQKSEKDTANKRDIKNSYEVKDLDAFAKRKLVALGKSQEMWQLVLDAGLVPRAGREGDRLEMFFLARVCAARGLDGSAHRLLASATEIPDSNGKPIPVEKINDALLDEIGRVVIPKAVMKFEDPDQKLTELLKQFTRLSYRFRKSSYAKELNTTVATLTKMVADDAVEKARREGGLNPKRDEILRRLVFDLRNQCGLVIHIGDEWGPGKPTITWDKKNQSPASKLERFGREAFPYLLEGLKDKSFTRTVHSDSGSALPKVIRVQDYAKEIIRAVLRAEAK